MTRFPHIVAHVCQFHCMSGPNRLAEACSEQEYLRYKATPACKRDVQADSLPRVLQWVKAQLPPLTSVPPDWSTIIAAGHSRGGWIAFKQLQQDNVVTAALLDAVAPPGAKYDSPSDAYLVVGVFLLEVMP